MLAQQITKAKKEQKTDLSETLKTFYTHHDALMADYACPLATRADAL